MDCWWPKTSGYPRVSGKVSRPKRHRLEHLILQQCIARMRQVFVQDMTTVIEIE